MSIQTFQLRNWYHCLSIVRSLPTIYTVRKSKVSGESSFAWGSPDSASGVVSLLSFWKYFTGSYFESELKN